MSEDPLVTYTRNKFRKEATRDLAVLEAQFTEKAMRLAAEFEDSHSLNILNARRLSREIRVLHAEIEKRKGGA